MARGTLITESLRLEQPLAGVHLDVTEVRRRKFSGLPPNQPSIWTFVEFDVPDETAEATADAIAACLDPVGGWYCDLHTSTDTVVAFPGRVFRYPAGDDAGRRAAAGHARRLGIPENQIDWPEA